MMSTKTKTRQSLERAISKYEGKLAKAPNPTQRQYAANMLRMAKEALAKSAADEPAVEATGADIVDLHTDEYAEI